MGLVASSAADYFLQGYELYAVKDMHTPNTLASGLKFGHRTILYSSRTDLRAL